MTFLYTSLGNVMRPPETTFGLNNLNLGNRTWIFSILSISFCKTGCSMLNGALIESDALQFCADVGVMRRTSAGSMLSMNESDGEKAQ